MFEHLVLCWWNLWDTELADTGQQATGKGLEDYQTAVLLIPSLLPDLSGCDASRPHAPAAMNLPCLPTMMDCALSDLEPK